MVLGPDEQRHRVLIPHCLAVTELNERTYCVQSLMLCIKLDDDSLYTYVRDLHQAYGS